MPNPYPVAFCRQARVLIDDGRTFRNVVASPGIGESCLHRWRRKQNIGLGLASSLSYADRVELAAAKQRIGDPQEEVKLLRKAATTAQEGGAAKRPVPPSRGSLS